MTDTVTISIDEASNKALFHHASVNMGLDVNSGANNTTLRAKILAAAPETTEIKVPATLAGPAAAPVVPIAAAPQSAASRTLTSHFRDDPKVELSIADTSEKTRAKDVQLSVNGDVCIVQRGKRVSIAYRFFEALTNAEETIGRETDEINPVTGLPIIEWVTSPSYPHSIYKMPSDEEIAAYHARTAGIGVEPAKAA